MSRTKSKMIVRCPECGGRLQATVVMEEYYSLSDSGKWTRRDNISGGIEDMRFYCENDHQLKTNNPDIPDLIPLRPLEDNC